MIFNSKGQTLLVIDDNPENLTIVVNFLKSQELEIMLAKNGADGIKKARMGKPDLILLDVIMPGMDGYETCHQLKNDELTKNIPVIFMSGLSEVEDKLKAFAVGAVDYVTKPIQQPELLARVCTHIQLQKLLKEAENKSIRLTDSLEVSYVVNVAIGVFMERHRISRQQAFNAIRNRARSKRLKIDEVAEELIANLDNLNMWPIDN